MPGGPDPDDLVSDDPPKLSLSQRRRERYEGSKPLLLDRLRDAMLKPPKPGTVVDEPLSVDELEAAVRSANDKERLIGLLAAPFAAAIGLLITSALISHDPAALLADGQANKLHVSVSLYHEVLIALLALAVVMLGMAWFRKRLYLGIVMALYGLTVFNLHYWGFGIPFIMCAAWLMVRSYRLQRSLREATGEGPWRPGSQASRRGSSRPAVPRPNKRYTPPTSRPSRARRPKPANELGTG